MTNSSLLATFNSRLQFGTFSPFAGKSACSIYIPCTAIIETTIYELELLVRNSDSGTQEAVIKFTTGSAASTACLLTNALVDNTNIKVEMFPADDEKTSTTNSITGNSSSAPTNNSFVSVFSTFASDVANKVRAIDQQYGITNTVAAGAATAWSESKRIVSQIDEKYKVKDTVSSTMQSAKDKVIGSSSSTANRSASPRGGSTAGSPRPSSPM